MIISNEIDEHLKHIQAYKSHVELEETIKEELPRSMAKQSLRLSCLAIKRYLFISNYQKYIL